MAHLASFIFCFSYHKEIFKMEPFVVIRRSSPTSAPAPASPPSPGTESITSFVDVGPLVELPDDLCSEEFLLYVGFTAKAARQIYQKWTKRDMDFNKPLMSYARGYIRSKAKLLDAVGRNGDWEKALLGMGIDKRLREVMQKPEHDLIRLTRSASFWVIDTMSEAEFVLSNAPLSAEERQRRSELNGLDDEFRFAANSDDSDAKMALEGASKPKSAEGREMFYKGGTLTRIDPCLGEDGVLRMGNLMSPAPSDFHPANRGMIYFYSSKDIAEKHARWAADRVPGQTPALLHIGIPFPFPGAREIHGVDWRDLVWQSRNSAAGKKMHYQLSSRLEQYGQANALLGGICADPQEAIDGMKQMYELNLLHHGPVLYPTQLALQTSSGHGIVKRECRGFAWVSALLMNEHK